MGTLAPLLALLGACLALDAREGLCPDPDTISPCKCAENPDYPGKVFVTCVGLTSAHQLDQIFGADFPKLPLDSVAIQYSSLGLLHQSVFHNKSMVDLRLTSGGVSGLARGVMAGSTATLESFLVNSNSLDTFDFTDLQYFPRLKYLYLSQNQLLTIDSLVDTEPHLALRALYLGSNYLTSLHPDTFKAVPGLTSLRLDYNRLTHLPAQVFYPLYQLQALSLKGNTLLHLGTGSLWLSTSVLMTMDLSLNGPGLTFDPYVFKGVGYSSQVDLGNNWFTTLDYDVFGELAWNVSQNTGWVDFGGNRITCDCSVLWLVQGGPAYQHVHSAMCFNWTYVEDLNPYVLADQCATGPK